FGTLLSSQGTDASFVLTPAGFPPDVFVRCFFVSFVLLRFRLYQTVSGVNPSRTWVVLAAFTGRSDE
ncbi:hypothetical protein ACIQM4_23830, partial [Streptomyces sp. NPDC091272]|uniref:hypothetical protein n=1 Tax=Streptomyces sp. NPDC091272 TaxID=3365981 RepID=UPI00381FBCF5